MAKNPHLFTGAVQYYERYRPGYPKAFFDFVRKRFQLDGTGQLLDLGCGTGQVLFPFARDFEEVVGLDPEPEMLREARRQARRHRVSNARWILGKAEEKIKTLGRFRLVTMGASFHWMKRRKAVLKTIYERT